MQRFSGWSRMSFQVYGVFVLIGLSLLLREVSLSLTDYKLVYGLDDPYIHLALAERILEGEYGINRGEAASPASSIAYPFMLAVGLLIDCREEVAFWLSLIAMGWVIWLMAGFLWDRMDEAGCPPSLWFGLLGGVGLVISLNAPTFPMIGMEHPWHILGTVLILKSAYELLEGNGGKMAVVGLSTGSLLAPLMRYEGFPLAAAGIVLLFLLRYYRTALLTIAILTGVVGAHMSMLWKAGLPLIPGSVLSKSGLMENLMKGDFRGAMDLLAEQLLRLLKNAGCGVGYIAECQTLFITAFFILLAAILLFRGKKNRYRYFWLLPMLVLFLHILGGSYGWMGRYEVYAVACLIMGLSSVLTVTVGPVSRMAAEIGISILLLAVSRLYFEVIITNPAASANIYAQQFQMHLFATRYFPYPVAINDLGWVSFGNKNYVLDLAGLASEEVRHLESRGEWNAQAMHQIALRKGVVYAMIYRHWFWAVPSEWCLVATLKTAQVTAAGDLVNIYLIDSAYRDRMEEALDRWAKALPPGSRLYRFNCLPDSEWQAIRLNL